MFLVVKKQTNKQTNKTKQTNKNQNKKKQSAHDKFKDDNGNVSINSEDISNQFNDCFRKYRP